LKGICGICSTSHPFTYCNAVENLLGITVPERAKYIRSIIGELERIHSHLLWMGLAGHFLGYNTVFMWAWKYREPVLDIFEIISGNRNHYAMFKIGGVRRNIENEDIPKIRKMLTELKGHIDMLIGGS
jgi:NADH-quinone oxidoreductase subunit D